MGIQSKRQHLQTIRHRYKYATWLLNTAGKRKAKIKKVHDKPKTPFHRLMESEHINNQTKMYLR